MRTAQELYEQIVLHLRKQGRKSEYRSMPEEVNICMYRGPEGLSCAIGCVIPPEEYDPKMEDNDLTSLMLSALLTNERRAEFLQSGALLHTMLRIHDSMPVEKWEINFRIVAGEFELEYPSL